MSAASHRIVPLHLGSWHGLCYDLADHRGLLDHLPTWLQRGRVDEGTSLSDDRVYRWRDVVVKFYRGRRRFGLRNPALRAAHRHWRLSPRFASEPVLALEHEGDGPLTGCLVYRYAEAATLADCWEDADARAALPRFLAALHARRLFHGDLHPDNLLWDDRRWLLIDLDGLRDGWQRWQAWHQIRRQFAHLCLLVEDPQGMRALYRDYARLADRRLPVDGWRQIRCLALRTRQRWLAGRGGRAISKAVWRRYRGEAPAQPSAA